jgi:hypothetical protein
VSHQARQVPWFLAEQRVLQVLTKMEEAHSKLPQDPPILHYLFLAKDISEKEDFWFRYPHKVSFFFKLYGTPRQGLDQA